MNDFYIQDATWSGDSNRLVVATGNNGGHMYEGPDWDEVEGTTSNGGLVAHHPTEDKLWYLNSDGSGNVYEYQNVPLAGYQWVMTRSFSFANAQKMISSPDGGELLLTDDYSTYVYSTSDYTQKETFDASRPLFSFDGTTMLLIEDDYWWNTYNLQLISTEDWSLEGSFHPEKYGRYAFSSNDSEIFMFSRADSSGVEQLTGYMPDTDGDGVVDYRDECPDTDTSEGSNSAGCAPSQRDTDFDSINDRDDLCPRTKSGASIDGNGCSVAQLTDSDNDGVLDSVDLCLNTPQGAVVDVNGCEIFTLPFDNNKVSVTSSTCIGSDDGSLAFSVEDASYDYTITVSGQDNPVTITGDNTTASLTGLGKGSYTVCFTVDGQDNYEQCFELNIDEPEELSAFIDVNDTNGSANFNLSGSSSYNININGESYDVKGNSFTADLPKGLSIITISTDLKCQGLIEREVFISEDILYYPNPTKGEVDVYIHGKDESVRMTVYSLKGDLIFTRKQTIRSTRKTDLDLVGVPAGTYLVNLEGKTVRKTFKIVKK